MICPIALLLAKLSKPFTFQRRFLKIPVVGVNLPNPKSLGYSEMQTVLKVQSVTTHCAHSAPIVPERERFDSQKREFSEFSQQFLFGIIPRGSVGKGYVRQPRR